ncbi:MAG TPA: class I SAM-dependent methyltransferase [Gemmatimonadaceae bacterium]|nr:class I SAM-dependent methyltransferase [Gemmatimonadaceae bacterium]
MSGNYSIMNYNEMIADPVRLKAYREAMRQSIHPDSVVTEIGTGSGYFAVFACTLGARKVIAIEPNDAIIVAMEVAEHNEVRDRIEFHHAMSNMVTPSEKADVIVSDMRGVLPFYGEHIRSIVDARTRLLKDGGTLIPSRDELYAAFVSAPKHLRYFVEPEPLDNRSPSLYPTRWRLHNNWSKARILADECASEPIHIGTLEYSTIESPHFASTFAWDAPERTPVHGVCVWFDTVLLGDIGFSNAPSAPEAVYSQAFFPFPEEIVLEAGDRAEVAFRIIRANNDYQYEWNTTISSAAAPSNIKAVHSQSTLRLQAMPHDKMRRRASHYTPVATRNQELVKFVLERSDGTKFLDDIAGDLAESFPDIFATRTAAFTFAADTLEQTR